MNLYRILHKHCGPKSSSIGVGTYLFADNEKQVFEYIDGINNGFWTERQEEQDEEPEEEDRTYVIYDDDLNEIGRETYTENIMRVKGDINSEHASYDEAFYGLDFYGWELIKEDVLGSEKDMLLSLGIAKEVE